MPGDAKMTDKYRIVFEGELADGVDLTQAKQCLTKLYKGNTKAVEKIFSKRSVVLKAEVTLEEGKKYKRCFEATGALCKLVPVTTKDELVNNAETKAAKTDKKAQGISTDAVKKQASKIKDQIKNVDTDKIKEKAEELRNKAKDIDLTQAKQKADELKSKLQEIDTSELKGKVSAFGAKVAHHLRPFFAAWWQHLKNVLEWRKADDKKQWALDNKASVAVLFATLFIIGFLSSSNKATSNRSYSSSGDTEAFDAVLIDREIGKAIKSIDTNKSLKLAQLQTKLKELRSSLSDAFANIDKEKRIAVKKTVITQGTSKNEKLLDEKGETERSVVDKTYSSDQEFFTEMSDIITTPEIRPTESMDQSTHRGDNITIGHCNKYRAEISGLEIKILNSKEKISKKESYIDDMTKNGRSEDVNVSNARGDIERANKFISKTQSKIDEVENGNILSSEKCTNRTSVKAFFAMIRGTFFKNINRRRGGSGMGTLALEDNASGGKSRNKRAMKKMRKKRGGAQLPDIIRHHEGNNWYSIIYYVPDVLTSSYKIAPQCVYGHHRNTYKSREILELLATKNRILIEMKNENKPNSKYNNMLNNITSRYETERKWLKIDEYCKKGNLEKFDKFENDLNLFLADLVTDGFRYIDIKNKKNEERRGIAKKQQDEYVESIKSGKHPIKSMDDARIYYEPIHGGSIVQRTPLKANNKYYTVVGTLHKAKNEYHLVCKDEGFKPSGTRYFELRTSSKTIVQGKLRQDGVVRAIGKYTHNKKSNYLYSVGKQMPVFEVVFLRAN